MQQNILSARLLYLIAAIRQPPRRPRHHCPAWPEKTCARLRVLHARGEQPFSPFHVRQNFANFRHKCIGSSETRHYMQPLVTRRRLRKNQAMPYRRAASTPGCDCFWESPGGDSVFSCALRRCRVRPAHFFVRGERARVRLQRLHCGHRTRMRGCHEPHAMA